MVNLFFSSDILEDVCHGIDAVVPVHLPAWSAAIVTFGMSEDAEEYGRDRHTCTVSWLLLLLVL